MGWNVANRGKWVIFCLLCYLMAHLGNNFLHPFFSRSPPEKQIRSVERYIRKLEFHISKVRVYSVYLQGSHCFVSGLSMANTDYNPSEGGTAGDLLKAGATLFTAGGDFYLFIFLNGSIQAECWARPNLSFPVKPVCIFCQFIQKCCSGKPGVFSPSHEGPQGSSVSAACQGSQRLGTASLQGSSPCSGSCFPALPFL